MVISNYFAKRHCKLTLPHKVSINILFSIPTPKLPHRFLPIWCQSKWNRQLAILVFYWGMIREYDLCIWCLGDSFEECVCVVLLLFSTSVVSDSFATPWTVAGSSVHKISRVGVGCHFLFQNIFLTRVWNPSFLHCKRILYPWASRGATHMCRRACVCVCVSVSVYLYMFRFI